MCPTEFELCTEATPAFVVCTLMICQIIFLAVTTSLLMMQKSIHYH